MKKAVINFWDEKQGTILQIFLGFIMLLFIGIMITVYVIAKRANPILLDEQGKPKYSQTTSPNY